MSTPINPVRTIYSHVGSDARCIAYTRDNDGEALPQGTTIDKIEIYEEFYGGKKQTFVTASGSVNTLKGAEDSPDLGVWNPAIDGKQGYNLEVIVDAKELKQGWYRVVVLFADNVQQEFALSVRE